MSDTFDYDHYPDDESPWERKQARANFRKETWETHDGKKILISEMKDSHLWNAYKYSQDGLLFREMVLRLFEMKIGLRS